MLSAGKITYEVGANIDATAYGGIAAVHRLATRLGLVEAIDAGVELLKVHLPYHESDHVLNIAYNVLCGGSRLEDIERLRHLSSAVGGDTSRRNPWNDLQKRRFGAGERVCPHASVAVRRDRDG
jgi:hypothetical protein